MRQNDTTAYVRDMLAQAKEFVEYVAGTEISGECFPVIGPRYSPAAKLRRQADALERNDDRIRRARRLLPEIKKVLEEC